MTRIMSMDQSLAKTAWVVMQDGEILDIIFHDFSKTPKMQTRLEIMKYTKEYARMYHIDFIVVERIGARIKWNSFATMIELGALVKFIVLAGYMMKIPVYSIDSRHWKTRATGSSKSTKVETIIWANAFIREQNYLTPIPQADSLVRLEDWKYLNEDESDALGICVASFTKDVKLKLEE